MVRAALIALISLGVVACSPSATLGDASTMQDGATMDDGAVVADASSQTDAAELTDGAELQDASMPVDGGDLDGGVSDGGGDGPTCSGCNEFHSDGCACGACNCIVPYYDGLCNSAAVSLSDLTVTGAIGGGEKVYYAVFFAPTSAAAFLTLNNHPPGGPISTEFRLYASQDRLPFMPECEGPPLAYSSLAPAPDGTKYVMLLTPPTPATSPYFIELLNTEPLGAPAIPYEIQVTQY